VESANDSQPYLFRSFQTIFLNFKTLKIKTFPTNENETVIQVIKTAKNRDFLADKIFKKLKIGTKIKEKRFETTENTVSLLRSQVTNKRYESPLIK